MPKFSDSPVVSAAGARRRAYAVIQVRSPAKVLIAHRLDDKRNEAWQQEGHGDPKRGLD
jgi:hypothetical protein